MLEENTIRTVIVVKKVRFFIIVHKQRLAASGAMKNV